MIGPTPQYNSPVFSRTIPRLNNAAPHIHPRREMFEKIQKAKEVVVAVKKAVSKSKMEANQRAFARRNRPPQPRAPKPRPAPKPKAKGPKPKGPNIGGVPRPKGRPKGSTNRKKGGKRTVFRQRSSTTSTESGEGYRFSQTPPLFNTIGSSAYCFYCVLFQRRRKTPFQSWAGHALTGKESQSHRLVCLEEEPRRALPGSTGNPQQNQTPNGVKHFHARPHIEVTFTSIWHEFIPVIDVISPHPPRIPPRGGQGPPETPHIHYRHMLIVKPSAGMHRFRNGMEYFRAGNVKSIKVEKGVVKAAVVGTKVEPYEYDFQRSCFHDIHEKMNVKTSIKTSRTHRNEHYLGAGGPWALQTLRCSLFFCSIWRFSSHVPLDPMCTTYPTYAGFPSNCARASSYRLDDVSGNGPASCQPHAVVPMCLDSCSPRSRIMVVLALHMVPN